MNKSTKDYFFTKTNGISYYIPWDYIKKSIILIQENNIYMRYPGDNANVLLLQYENEEKCMNITKEIFEFKGEFKGVFNKNNYKNTDKNMVSGKNLNKNKQKYNKNKMNKKL